MRKAFEPQLPEAGVADCYDGNELQHFRGTLQQGFQEHTEEQESLPTAQCVKFRELDDGERDQAISEYLDSGFGLTDLYCQRYFVIAAESDKKRQFQRNSGSTVDALMNAVLGLSSAGQTAIGIANASFEAYDSTYQNIQDAFMVAPELSNVRKLVHAAQGDYKERVKNDLPTSYQHARSIIERYAGMCSYTGMKQLVNDSVASETTLLLAAAENRSPGLNQDPGEVANDEQAPAAPPGPPAAPSEDAPSGRVPIP
ncbi:MAG: hypothetical protein KKD08_05495 [Alphaproteobacteria bacterium]|nr:hypothetical protein [Alphaproteobacteria bacterium]